MHTVMCGVSTRIRDVILPEIGVQFRKKIWAMIHHKGTENAERI
jgi:hypothetical protein